MSVTKGDWRNKLYCLCLSSTVQPLRMGYMLYTLSCERSICWIMKGKPKCWTGRNSTCVERKGFEGAFTCLDGTDLKVSVMELTHVEWILTMYRMYRSWHSNPAESELFFFLFYRREHWGLERWADMREVTHHASRARAEVRCGRGRLVPACADLFTLKQW